MIVFAENDKVSKKNKIYALIALSFTVVAIIVRILCLEFYFDEDIGYYKNELLPKILALICVIGVVSFASSCFFIKNSTVCSDGKEDNVAVKIVSAVCMLACVVYFSISVFSTALVASGLIFDLLSKISVLMALAYFAINIFPSDGVRTVQTLLGFGLIYFCIYVIAITYFDIYVQLNAPNKVMIHLALIAAMIFFVNEFRCFMETQKRRFYLFALSLAVFFTGTAAVPTLIYALSNGFDFDGYKYFAYDIVILSFFIYSSTRLVSYAFGVGGKRLCEKEEDNIVNTDETENK